MRNSSINSEIKVFCFYLNFFYINLPDMQMHMQVGAMNVTAGYRLKDNTSSTISPTRVPSHTWRFLLFHHF